MHLLHIFYMEKTIATYYKYFRNAEPDYDFRDTIEERQKNCRCKPTP